MLSQCASPVFSVEEVILLGAPKGPVGLELDARGKGVELTPFLPRIDFKEIFAW